MHDINPLGTTMHLRELDRQAAPRLRAVPSRKPDVYGAAVVIARSIALVRRWIGRAIRLNRVDLPLRVEERSVQRR
jgi:hypothetical protein